MSESKERRMWLLSYPEFREMLDDTDLAFLPVGVCEAHGNHLPLGTDSIIAEWLAEKLADRLNGMVAPPISYGVVRGLSGYWGSISIEPEVLEALVYGVLRELSDNGFERIVIVSGHGGTDHITAIERAMKRVWAEKGLKTLLVKWWELASDLTMDMLGADGGHAGIDETAMILAISEELVTEEVIEEEVYRVRDGLKPYPLPGSIIAYSDGFQARVPDTERAKEYAERVLSLLEEEIRKILEGWDRQELEI